MHEHYPPPTDELLTPMEAVLIRVFAFAYAIGWFCVVRAIVKAVRP